jgi:HEAT repeat protein
MNETKNRRHSEVIRSRMAALGAATERDLLAICRDGMRPTEERTMACSLLGQIRSRRAIPLLLKIGSQEEEQLLVWEALSAVGAIHSRTATPRLMQLIRTSASPFKRQAAVFALWRLTDVRARPLLIRILRNEREDVKTRAFAAEALGLLPLTRNSVSAMIAALDDPSVEVRYSAVCGFSGLRSTAAVPALKRLLTDNMVVDGQPLGKRAAKVLVEISASWRRKTKTPNRR